MKLRRFSLVAVFFFSLVSLSNNAKTIAPADYTITTPQTVSIFDGTLTISASAEHFYQGDCVYLEINGNTPDDLYASTRFYRIHLQKRSWGMNGFFPIPTDAKPGNYTIDVTYKENGKKSTAHLAYTVNKRNFSYEERALDLGDYSDVNYEKDPENKKLIEEARKRKNAAFASLTPLQTSETFAHPRDMHYITSTFFETRLYKQYKTKMVKNKKKKIFLKNSKRTHRGIDFRGKTGSPVFAVARGTVVLAFKCFYEGNMVILDHGNRFFTYYMHMDSIAVKEGDVVEAGERIGNVGSTGISTGSHLHVSAIIDNVQIDPLSILPLPAKR